MIGPHQAATPLLYATTSCFSTSTIRHPQLHQQRDELPTPGAHTAQTGAKFLLEVVSGQNRYHDALLITDNAQPRPPADMVPGHSTDD
jgi:hypothetical protein